MGANTKDPSSSIYTHLEIALHADHDIFHGYTPNCPELYDYTKVYNSSLCEQFISFVGVVKNAAKQMSQFYFTFLMQFIIKAWNDKKRKSILRKMNIAAVWGQ